MFLSYSRLKPWDSGVGLKVSQHIWSLLCDGVKPVSHKKKKVNSRGSARAGRRQGAAGID